MVIISGEEIHVTDSQVKKVFYISLVLLIVGTMFTGIYFPIFMRDLGDISQINMVYLSIGLATEFLGIMGLLIYIFKPSLIRNMLVNREKQMRKRKEKKEN